jgi:hypothetical protein
MCSCWIGIAKRKNGDTKIDFAILEEKVVDHVKKSKDKVGMGSSNKKCIELLSNDSITGRKIQKIIK